MVWKEGNVFFIHIVVVVPISGPFVCVDRPTRDRDEVLSSVGSIVVRVER